MFFLIYFSLMLWGESADVLIIHSYHEGFSWTDDINRSLRNRLEKEERTYEIHIEYMDSKRIDPEVIFPVFNDFLKSKYGSDPPDVIICSDNNAFNFLKLYRDTVLGAVPVVFCGVNDFDMSMLEGFPLVSGVTEEADHSGTIDLILTVQPDVTHIAAISDSVPTGILHEKAFSRLVGTYRDRVELVSLAKLNRKDLKEALDELPDTSAVIYLSYYNDGSGRRLGDRESVILLSEMTDLPLYGLWDWNIGLGTVGGMVISGKAQGKIAGDLAVQILEGATPGSMPVVTDNTNLPMFDHNYLSAIPGGIDWIPRDAVMMNEPYRFYRENKVLVWLVLCLFIILILFIITLLMDSLRRRRLITALNEQKNILRGTLDNIPLYVLWKDKWGRTLGGNKAYFERFGHPDLAAEPDGFSGEEREFIGQLEREARSGPVLFREGEVTDLEGKKRVYIVTVVLQSHRESPLDRILLIQDISERRILENRLRQSQKMESLGRLSGGIAHDFNNLLTGILGAVDLLRPGMEESGEKSTYLDMITESCDQASGLVKGILSYSRKTPLEYTQIDIDGLLKGTEAILRRTLKKNIALECESKHPGMKLSGDRAMIQSALINLGVNAADAMPRGGMISITVDSISADQIPREEGFNAKEGDYMIIRFRDQGEGIPPEIMDHLFDPFFTTKEPGRGTGLGLAGVYGTVKSHGGCIAVESSPGEGTTFFIYLPAVPE